MPYTIREIEQEIQFHQQVSVDLITEIVPVSEIEAVIVEWGVGEKPCRKLPALLMVLVCIGMHLYSHYSIEYVVSKLLAIPRLLLGLSPSVLANRGSISSARYRLGAKVLEQLFKRICRPIASK